MMRDNVEAQQGWLVLSPSAEQIVVQTSHAVEEDDPQLVIDVILDVLEAARGRADQRSTTRTSGVVPGCLLKPPAQKFVIRP